MHGAVGSVSNRQTAHRYICIYRSFVFWWWWKTAWNNETFCFAAKTTNIDSTSTGVTTSSIVAVRGCNLLSFKYKKHENHPKYPSLPFWILFFLLHLLDSDFCFSWKIQCCDWSTTLDSRRPQGGFHVRTQWVWRCCVDNNTILILSKCCQISTRNLSFFFFLLLEYILPSSVALVCLVALVGGMVYIFCKRFVCVFDMLICCSMLSESPRFTCPPPQEDINRSAAVTSGADSHGEGPIWVQSIVVLCFCL